jgi:hypothetical protein
VRTDLPECTDSVSIISSHERSVDDFADVDVCAEAIKNRKKKVS